MSSESSAKSDASAAGDWRWGVFGNLAFTVMLIASSASNVGFAMFDTSSNWLMTSLNPDPMIVSAVQVATTLPMFLLTLPAGALTDIIDARRMLIGAQIAVTAISVVFAAVVTMHLATPAVVLATAFCLGGSGALAAPAWLVITPMLVPKRDLDSAIAINNASYNVSRALGPAIAGLGIATFSIALPFWCFCAGNIAVLAALLWWRAPRRTRETLPAERLFSA
ncbi:MAG: MFS transporter, partial [Hyphomicrobiales bacterium]|nr:MFS transporter [Hyphomicrobiales bacterium]